MLADPLVSPCTRACRIWARPHMETPARINEIQSMNSSPTLTLAIFASMNMKCRHANTLYRPYSGSIFVRTDPAIHRAVDAAARASGQSINQWAQAALMEKLSHTPQPGR